MCAGRVLTTLRNSLVAADQLLAEAVRTAPTSRMQATPRRAVRDGYAHERSKWIEEREGNIEWQVVNAVGQ